MHPMIAHASSAGTAKKLWAEASPPTRRSRWRSSRSRPSPATTSSSTTWACASIAHGHGFSGVNFSIHSSYSSVAEYEAAMKKAYGEERGEDDPRHRAPQHRLLPEPHHQGRDPVDPRGAAARRRQDPDRVVDLPPEGRARRAPPAHRRLQPPDQLADVGRRPRRPALLPVDPGRTWRRRRNDWVDLQRNFAAE